MANDPQLPGAGYQQVGSDVGTNRFGVGFVVIEYPQFVAVVAFQTVVCCDPEKAFRIAHGGGGQIRARFFLQVKWVSAIFFLRRAHCGDAEQQQGKQVRPFHISPGCGRCAWRAGAPRLRV